MTEYSQGTTVQTQTYSPFDTVVDVEPATSGSFASRSCVREGDDECSVRAVPTFSDDEALTAAKGLTSRAVALVQAKNTTSRTHYTTYNNRSKFTFFNFTSYNINIGNSQSKKNNELAVVLGGLFVLAGAFAVGTTLGNLGTATDDAAENISVKQDFKQIVGLNQEHRDAAKKIIKDTQSYLAAKKANAVFMVVIASATVIFGGALLAGGLMSSGALMTVGAIGLLANFAIGLCRAGYCLTSSTQDKLAASIQTNNRAFQRV